MREEVKILLKGAQDSLASAKLLLKEKHYNVSVSRSYYAMFYAAEAVLLTRDIKFSSHKSVISLFGQHFVKKGLFPAELGKDLREAFNKRVKGDYVFEYLVSYTYEDAENAVKRAERFVAGIKQYLEKEVHKTS